MSSWDPALFLLLLAFCGALWAYQSEKRDWNGGTCSECGCRWILFDRNILGDGGYNCYGCEPSRCIWISWPGIDEKA